MIKHIVKKYIAGRTIRSFADSLSVNGTSISHATIINWRSGRTEPTTDYLVTLVTKTSDWRRDFALECLASKKPDVWGDKGSIWNIR